MSGEAAGGDIDAAHDEHDAASEWNDLTVPQLKEELQERGLEVTGRKADLIARIIANDKEILKKMSEEVPTGNGEAVNEGEEGDFVVWNDEHDTDKLLDEAGNAADDEDAGEEVNQEEEAREPEQDDIGAAGEKKEGAEEVDVPEVLKAENFDKDVEYAAKVATNKEVLLMTWRHHRIKVPFRDETTKEMRHFTKKQNIIMYPVELSDLYSDIFRRHIEIATNVSMELDETIPGSPPKGYLRLKFGSVAEAESAIDEIKEQRKQQEREINMRTFSENDSEGEVLSQVKKEDTSKRDPLVHRLLFVANLPSEVTEAALKDHFVGVLRVYLSRNEDSQDHNGYAYLEYRSEAETNEMVQQYRDTELYGQMLYVIKSLTQRKDSFGLLKDSLRKYWLEQLANLEATKAKNVVRTAREITELDAKLMRLKRRIDKDNAIRESVGLPVPENEKFGTTEADSDKEKEKSKEKESPSSKKEERSSERKSTPSRRHHSPPSHRGSYRGSSSRGMPYRGGSRGYMSSSRGGSSYSRGGAGGRENADVLVNQLQELVGVLTNRVPDAGPMRSSGGYSRGPPPAAPPDNYGSYRGGSGGSRYSSGKRPHEDDYPMDRKRRMDEGGYYGGGGGRGGNSRDNRSNYGMNSYGGGSRRGNYY